MKVAKAVAAPSSVTVAVTDASGGAPIKGAQIVAFTDFAARQGTSGTTGANGRVTLLGLSSNRKLERVYVYAPAGFWGFYNENIAASKVSQIKLTKIDVRAASLLLSQLYGSLPANAGEGVTVGVIDSGVDGKHPT
jgi:subtilisin